MTKKAAAATPKFRTNLHKIFATDTRLEEEGAWVVVNDFVGLSVKVRRMRSDAANRAYERLIRETLGEGKLRKPDEITADQSVDLLKQHLAQNILCDWKGLRDEETGVEIPYSIECSRALMDIKDFREFVLQAANERDTYRETADAEAEGN
jgi:hypothetical protein